MISVMNFEVTFRQCSNFFSLSKSPDKLLKLKASTDMQDSGNVFNPDHYMIDESTDIVYRKEQFSSDDKLPAELLVRDRRYRLRDIEATCMKAGLRVLWSRYVQSGRWEIELAPEDPKAKEILLLCEALTY